ncbi:MAG: MFS transporter [Candidatus Latescibacteria bacterium]|nr:MFS transporter [Candidatus Latescibacterota bacterium]
MDEPVPVHPRFFDPTSNVYRWVIMVAAGLMLFGSYFAYDSIGALSPLIIEGLGIDREAIGLLYSFYSWPNVVMVLIGGIMIDRFGTRVMSIVLSSLIVLGAVIVAAAPNLTVMIIGRTIFGIGAESLIVCQSAILAKWFKGKELALAFGFALTFMRLGTLVSFNIEATVAEAFGGWRAALWFAAGLCALSMIFTIFYITLEQRARDRTRLAEAPAGDKIVISDIKNFGPSLWFITLLCVTFYAAIFPFTSLSTDFFVDKWGVSTQLGGRITSIIVFFSMVLAPIIGGFVDRIGRRGTLLLLGTLLMIPSHALMGLTTIYPIIPMAVLGFSFSLVSAVLWPAVPLIVKEKAVGTAFGLIFMIQNIGLALFPWLNGLLRDATQSYTASQLMFASLGLVGFVFAILLLRSDAKAGGILEKVKLGKEAPEPVEEP